MSSAAALVRHPVNVAALRLWLLNDHVLKGRGPGWLTGKLSDVACLVVVPLMFAAAVELWRTRGERVEQPLSWSLPLAVVATGAVMASINLWGWAADGYRYGLAALQWPLKQVLSLAMGDGVAAFRAVRLTMDPTDLLTLPALLVPLWLWRASVGEAESLKPRTQNAAMGLLRQQG